MAASDGDLLQRWAQGDRAAGDELFVRHFEPVLRFFTGRVDGDAEDLTQATFLGALEARDRFRGDASFRTFLFAIARNQLLIHFARRHRGERITFRTMSMADLAPSATRRLAATQARERIACALEKLPVDLQLAIELYYWEGLDVAELAAVLECPQGTAKRWLWRARQLLAAELGLDDTEAALADTER